VSVQPRLLFEVFGLPITDTILSTWAVMAILVVGAILVTRRFQPVPDSLQNIAETIVEGFTELVINMMGENGVKFVPLIMTIGLFTLLGNTIGLLPGLKAPTSDLATTAALAVIVFLVAHGAEIAHKGLAGYIRGYFEPFWWMLPMNIMGEFARVLSHAFRLYGNMVGGAVIVGIVFTAVPWIMPVPLNGWFSMFMGLIQAAVFTLLAIAYIQIRLD